jgi:hypothetical protein
MLSRCAITASLWRLLPPATELPFQGHHIPVTRNVLMTRLQAPNVGDIHVYNTLLCAYCAAADRLEQAQWLRRFVQRVETLAPDTHPICLGGISTPILGARIPRKRSSIDSSRRRARFPSKMPMRSRRTLLTRSVRFGVSGATTAASTCLRKCLKGLQSFPRLG